MGTTQGLRALSNKSLHLFFQICVSERVIKKQIVLFPWISALENKEAGSSGMNASSLISSV